MKKIKFKIKSCDYQQLKIIDKNTIEVSYPNTDAVTPGQEIVIYDKNKVVCGAIIDKIFNGSNLKDYIR